MKQALKFIGAFIISLIIGFAIGQLAVVLFTDVTLTESVQKFAKTDWFELITVGGSCAIIFIVSIFLQIFVHEGGHLVGGLMSGYRFVSFRIFNWVIIRIDNKLQIKKFKIAGTGGQCLLTPPDKPIEEIPTTLYNIAGVLSNIIFSIIMLAIWLVLMLCFSVDSFFVGYAAIVFALVGIFLAILNGIPMKVGGIGNDGYNVKLLNKNLQSKEAFVIQLRANALVQNGLTPKEMPKEWFELENANYNNALQMSVYLMKASYLMDIGQLEEAHQMLENALTNRDKMIGLLINETECELIFTSLATGRKERAQQLYTPELQKYIKAHRKVMSSKERTLWAVAKYIENDHDKAQQIYTTICNHKDEYLMQGEVKMDIELIGRLK